MEDKLANGGNPEGPPRQQTAAIRPDQPRSDRWQAWIAYGLSVIVTVAALWVRLIIKIEIGDRPLLILFMVPIIISAYWGGLGPGLVSTAVAAVGLEYFFIPPTVSFSIARGIDFAQWIILIMSGILVSVLSEALRRSRRGAEVSKDQLSLITNSVPALISYIDANCRYRSVNQTYEVWFGLKQEDIVGRHVREVVGEAAWEKTRPYIELALGGERVSYEEELFFQYGRPRWVSVSYTPDRDDQGQTRGFITLVQDISRSKRAEKERELAIDFLRLVNQSRHRKDMILTALTFFRQHSGCEAAGVRLHEERDYPYYEIHGFPAEFVQEEKSLLSPSRTGEIIRDSTGNHVLECMCGNIIRGRFDPSKPFFTKSGSFWTNSTSELLASTTESDRQARMCNRCNGEGYESMALIALHVGEDRLGLLQLNDRRKGLFSPEDIVLWERLAGYLAVALAKFQAEELLRSSEELYRSLFDNMLNGFAYCRMLFSQDQPRDFIYLAVNDAFTASTGLKDVVGKRVTEVIPGIRESDPKLFEIYGRVALSGKPERFEMYVSALRMWFSISVYSPGKEHFVAVFDVITERKQMEEALQQSFEYLDRRVQERTSELAESNKKLEGEIERRSKVEAELTLNQAQLRNLYLNLQSVREGERASIACEIHDELGQIMAAMRMNVAWMKNGYSDHKVISEKASEILELIDGTIKSIRRICAELRPDVLDHFGLGAAIQWQAEEFSKRSGIPCEVSVEDGIQVDSDRSIALFRIFQEALANILRHANATKVMARLTGENDKIILEIKDNGKGITPEEISKPNSFGLAGMRERVYPWRGSVSIGSSPNEGTRIEVILPRE